MLYKFEPKSKPPLTPALFRRRVLMHFAFVTALILASLAVGMIGYVSLTGMGMTDAFLNSAMLLGGMGPVATDLKTDAAKIFAGLYALYCGLAVIAASGLLFAPFIHRIMHRLHWVDKG